MADVTPDEVKLVMASMTEDDFKDLARDATLWKFKAWAVSALIFLSGLLIGMAAMWVWLT